MAGAAGAGARPVPHGRGAARVRVSPPTREGQGSRRGAGGSEHKKVGKANTGQHEDQRLVCLGQGQGSRERKREGWRGGVGIRVGRCADAAVRYASLSSVLCFLSSAVVLLRASGK